MITMRTFVDGLEALSVTGVTRYFLQGPPAGATSTPDLPAMFIYLPQISGATKVTLGNQGGGGTLQAQVMILVEPVAQNKQGVNFDASVDLVDALEAALIAAGCAIGGVLGWSIRVTNFAVAELMYWVVEATITGGRW